MTYPSSERYVPQGEAYVYGQSPELARKLLDTARELGHDPHDAVRTGDDGFYVPADVAEAVYPPKTPTKEGKK